MLYTSLNLDKSLEFATFCITVIAAISNDDMVEQVQTHDITGPLDAGGQSIIVLAGTETA